jgi:hypothetical protein
MHMHIRVSNADVHNESCEGVGRERVIRRNPAEAGFIPCSKEGVSACALGLARKRVNVNFVEATARSTRAGEILHHQTRAALRDVRDDGGATMNLRHDAEVDGEGKMNR